MPVVRLVEVDAASVVNLCHPARDAVIIRDWRGRRDWHDPLYDPVRDLMERVYVEEFDRENGHYRRLEESVLRDGVKAPVMLVSGGVRRRRVSEMPPHLRDRPDLLVCEYLGGSRLYIAAKHAMRVPAVVNDFADLFPGAPELRTVEDVAAAFPVPPKVIRLDPIDGAYVNDMDYSHMPAGYDLEAQIPVRRRVVEKVRAAVDGWLAENDR
ncbi:MAG: hypothetical protein KIS96_03520 [Bauldia sp.]|nr:hypothetical protein [Bauldia sp.]